MLAAGGLAAARPRRARQAPALRCLASTPPADPGAATLCGQPVPAPAPLPPAGSGPLVYVLGLCFSTQGNQSAVEPETYLYYLRLRPSRPSQREWVPFDDGTRETIKEDFRRLWATGFLDDLKVEATDYTFANGVVGKIVTYHIEERARVRLVKYEGAGDLEQTKIDEQLREQGAEIKLDAFLDQGVIRRARTVLRDLLAEKGFAAAEVSSAIDADRRRQAGGPHLRRHARAEAGDPRRCLHRQSRRRRRRPRQGAEEQPAAGPAVARHQPRRLQRDHLRRRRAARRGLLPRPGLRRRPRRPARGADARRFRRRQDPLRAAADPGLRGPPLPRRHPWLRRPDDRAHRGAAGDLQAEAGRLVPPAAHPRRPRQGARDLRLDRAHGVHRLSRPETAGRAGSGRGRHHAARRSRRRRGRRAGPPSSTW